MHAIRTEALTKHYSVGFWRPRPYAALDSLDLQVDPGEVFGFLGPNGAGKTTTLKLLMQLIFPTRGTAEILGRPAGDVGVRRRIGYLPENPTFYDNVSGEELLTYFASLFGYRGGERTARVARLLDEVGLGAERRLRLRKYSKGMVQRVGLAQALLNDPEVVFLDEPMSGLDPLGRRVVRDIILRLRDRGTTVFFSSHILSDAEAICSRVAIVASGKLVAAGALAEMVPFQIRGWELTVTDVTEAVARVLTELGVAATTISAERHHVRLPAGASPEDVVARIAAAGGRILSLAPVRETLEDVFVAQVKRTETRAFDSSAEEPRTKAD
jgi:ABC-2 type transport system ATP-binding protein